MQVKKQLKKVAPKEQKQIAGGGSWPVWPQTPIGQCPNPDVVVK